MDNLKYKKRKGLTLSEVMVTLAVIGVVAGLTIPVFVAQYEDTVRKATAKKLFVDTRNVFLQIRADNKGTFEGAFQNNTEIKNKIRLYLNGFEASANSGGTCHHDSINLMNGDEVTWNPWASGDCIITMDGSWLVLGDFYIDCDGIEESVQNMCGEYAIDVNGEKGPDTWGKDLFFVWILKDDIYPAGAGRPTPKHPPATSCRPSGDGHGCLTYVLQNKDY